MFEVQADRDQVSCEIYNTHSHLTFKWHAQTEFWVSREGPGGDCGLVTIGTLQHDKGELVSAFWVRLSTGYYLVDTASRPGMSGAPVILRSWTNDYIEGGMRALSDKAATNLIGVYSGKLVASSEEAQIGMVWHELYIMDIIAGRTRDED